MLLIHINQYEQVWSRTLRHQQVQAVRRELRPKFSESKFLKFLSDFFGAARSCSVLPCVCVVDDMLGRLQKQRRQNDHRAVQHQLKCVFFFFGHGFVQRVLRKPAPATSLLSASMCTSLHTGAAAGGPECQQAARDRAGTARKPAELLVRMAAEAGGATQGSGHGECFVCSSCL